MDFPKEVLEIARSAVMDFPDDLDKSIEMAWDAIANLPDYESYHELFIRRCIQELVYQVRHMNNRVIRNGGTPKNVRPEQKVKLWTSSKALDVYEGVYTYAMNGRMLATMTGEDLKDARNVEAELRDGHEFNVKLCDELLKRVKAKQEVKAVFTKRQLENLFERLRA